MQHAFAVYKCIRLCSLTATTAPNACRLLQAPISCCCGWHSAGFVGTGLTAASAAYTCGQYRAIMPLGTVVMSTFQRPDDSGYAPAKMAVSSFGNTNTITVTAAATSDFNSILYSDFPSSNAVIDRGFGNNALVTEGYFTLDVLGSSTVEVQASGVARAGGPIQIYADVYSTCFRGPLAADELGHVNTSMVDAAWPPNRYYVLLHTAGISRESIKSITIAITNGEAAFGAPQLPLPQLPKVAMPRSEVCAALVPPKPPVPSVSNPLEQLLWQR